MGRRQRDPLFGCRRLVIDGSNQRDNPAEPVLEEPLAGSLARLFPHSLELIVVFDTDPPIGAGTIRRIGGVTVIHARAGGGDDRIVALLEQSPEDTLVVTDDADLRRRVTAIGGRVERNEWLRQRRAADHLAAGSVGRRMIRSLPVPAGEADEPEADPPAWRPGRGATRKRGPTRRPGRQG